jgi:hypothetical protein
MLILCKIHDEKYIEDMFSNEYLYISWLGEFRSNDFDETGRLDPKELNIETSQLKTLTLKTEEKEIHLHKMGKNFNAQYNIHIKESQINCCSLHWIEVEQNESPSTFNEKLITMGNKILLIYDWQKFFEILDNSLEKLNYEYSRKKTSYYNPKIHNGKLSLHHKDFKFEWQNEYRILIQPTNKKPIKVPIPGLKLISTIINTSDYMKLNVETEK